MQKSPTGLVSLIAIAVGVGIVLVATAKAQGDQRAKPVERIKPITDDPKAHALYDGMVKALREASSLSYECDYAWYGEGGREISHNKYRARLQKPNRFRIDSWRSNGAEAGVLIGDGRNAWIHWPNGRPFFSTENPKDRSKPRDEQYYKIATPQGRHSIGHMVGLLGAGMSMTVIDPSTFHGYTDSMQRYLDGVKHLGAASTTDGEECDIILVSFMKGQRTWKLWLARSDHLPRILVGTARVSYDIVTREHWKNVRVNPELDPDTFSWSPPEGYERWWKPDPKNILLEKGTPAPDFNLLLADGKRRRLRDLKGKVVWLIFWRVG